jgi:hypothetical protein
MEVLQMEKKKPWRRYNGILVISLDTGKREA